jgi:hypothetical protein
MIYAPIPIYGRFSLVRLTMERLIKQGVTPIGIGNEPQAKQICKELEVEYIEHANNPLGAKWNAGFKACNKPDCESVLFVGSSDWISDSYLKLVKKHLNKYDIIGVAGCHFVDVAEVKRLVYWSGYPEGLRHNEPIGIGRVLSIDFLKRINFKPFDGNLNAGLDWSMYLKAKNVGLLPNTKTIQCLSISTNKWGNKHKFEDHWNGVLPSEKMNPNLFLKLYPEINEI